MPALFRKIFDILPSSDKGKLTLLFLLMLIAAALEIVSISLILAFVSVVADPERLMAIGWLAPVLEYLKISNPRDLLLYGSLALLGVFIVKNIYMVTFAFIQGSFIYNRFQAVSNRLFQSYMGASYIFHLRNNTSKLVRNVTTEAYFFAHSVITNVLSLAKEAVLLAVIFIFLFSVNPLVTLVVLAVVGSVGGLLIKFLRKRTQQHGSRALEERASMIQEVSEGLGGFKEARVMNRELWFTNRFRLSVGNVAKSELFIFALNQSMMPAIETVAVLGILLITFILSWQGKDALSIIAALALFGIAIIRIMPALSILISDYNTLKYHGHSVSLIADDLMALKNQDESARAESRTNKPRINFQDSIKLEGVSYVYPETSRLVLDDVSLVIPKNAVVGLVGASGAGKTTVVDLILGLLNPDKGIVTVDGMDIRRDLRGWRKKVGYIPQSVYLLDNTVRNNIAFGLDEKSIDEERVLDVINIARLNDLIRRSSGGLDSMIGERGVRLSGGERQRVGIARALYHNPEVLIMDEATSSLDNRTEKYVIEAIEGMRKNRTIIVIAHRLITIQNCDILHMLKNGRVIASGSYEELFKKSDDFKLMANLS